MHNAYKVYLWEWWKGVASMIFVLLVMRNFSITNVVFSSKIVIGVVSSQVYNKRVRVPVFLNELF